MSMVDKDGDGGISFEEFRDFVVKMLLVAFDRLDKNQSGFLRSNDLIVVSRALDRDHNQMMRNFGQK